MDKVLKSPNGHPLVYQESSIGWQGTPVVTVELYIKWYGVYVVSAPTDGSRVQRVSFPDMGSYETLGSPYVDHAPNPRHVCAWAEQMGYVVDDLSLEMMIGRWELECGSRRYEDLFHD